jgi:hypothetical protein
MWSNASVTRIGQAVPVSAHFRVSSVAVIGNDPKHMFADRQ